MEIRKLPRVLVIDVNAWRNNAGSNTLREIFSCWDPERLAVVYTSSQLPDSEICKNYFQISENQVLKSVFRPMIRVGQVVENTPIDDSDDAVVERTRYQRTHKKHSKWMRLAREVVWKLGHWKTAALKKFILDFDPDVIFVPIFPNAYMGRIQEYIINLSGKPTVGYLADDNYSYDACKDVVDYIHRFWTRQYVGPLARGCKEMFVIVDKEKEDTDRRFGTDSVILTKSIDFTGRTFKHKSHDLPLKIVYTGSLLLGRDKTLALVADAINQQNKDGVMAELFIYSQNQPDSKMMQRLDCASSHYCGYVPYQQIQGILEDADVVVFAEALDGKDANIAKLSFSTKITDYLSNGKCILAIGKEDIAPIDYFKKYDSALVATTKEDIIRHIKTIVGDPTIIDLYGKKAYDCAVKNHNKEIVQRRFIETICKAK